MAHHEFDLVVVGSGTGLDVANWGVAEGWRVALVEKGPLGGTCLNRGCIPSKLLIHSADVAEAIRRAPLFGIHPKGFDVDFPTIVERATESVDADSKMIEEGLLAAGNPRLFRGAARFVAPRTLRVGDDTLVGKRVLLATGARPTLPPIAGLEDVPFLTSTEALRLDRLPRTMTIIGGGFIATELGHFFGSLGTDVAIVARQPLLLAGEDEEVRARFTESFAKRHRVLAGCEARRAGRDGDDIVVEGVEVATGKPFTVRSETLLVAAGVTPNSDKLDLDKAGIAIDARGFIVADEYLETTAPGVWALGDAIGKFLYKHNANHEATYVIANMVDPAAKVPVDYHAMPHAVFTSPQIAAVGATEADLQSRGVAYAVGRWAYRDTAMGHAIEDHEGFVKLLVDKETSAILGCHIMGSEAATLIHEVVVAMSAGEGGLRNLTQAIHVHPALPEVVHRAATSVEL